MIAADHVGFDDGLAALAALVAVPADDDSSDQLVETLHVLVALVPGARWATLGERKRRVRPQTVASTGEAAWLADAVQYHLGEGPTLQAMDRRMPVFVTDATTEPRWPRFAAAATSQLAIRSVLSVPLRGVRGKDASLSFYGDSSDAFVGSAIDMLPVAIASADITLAGLRQRQRSQNLARALGSNRRIGVSVGILMAQHHWTEDEAFNALGVVSQALNRKVADLADEVCLTGTLPSAPLATAAAEPRPAGPAPGRDDHDGRFPPGPRSAAAAGPRRPPPRIPVPRSVSSVPPAAGMDAARSTASPPPDLDAKARVSSHPDGGHAPDDRFARKGALAPPR